MTETPATSSSPMTIWAWDFLASVRITCPLVRRRTRADVYRGDGSVRTGIVTQSNHWAKPMQVGLCGLQ